MPLHATLKAELANDPLGKGYSGMTDDQVVVALNVADRENPATWSGSKVLNVIVKPEYDALTAANKALIWDVLHLGELNPYGIEAALFVAAFGPDSATIKALAALRNAERITRAQELGLGDVAPYHVWEARNR